MQTLLRNDTGNRSYSSDRKDCFKWRIVVNEIPPSNNKYMGNSRNFNEYRREKERWHWLIKCAIKERPKKPMEKAVVSITYYFKTKGRRDPDNYSGKMLLDPLVKEGILVDDSFANITLVLSAGHDKDNPRTEIEVKEYSK